MGGGKAWLKRILSAFQQAKEDGLTKGTDYTLIYYPDPWPANGLICLGSAIANGKKGKVEIEGKIDVGGDLPLPFDANAQIEGPTGIGITGAKIWLVHSSAVDCVNKKMTEIEWNPTEYLFEGNPILYFDTTPK